MPITKGGGDPKHPAPSGGATGGGITDPDVEQAKKKNNQRDKKQRNEIKNAPTGGGRGARKRRRKFENRDADNKRAGQAGRNRRHRQNQKNKSPHIDRQRMAQSYGWALAVLRSDPELEDLFNRAVKHTWTPDKFIAELRSTDWFRKNADTMRQAIVLQKTDPATYRNRVAQLRAHVTDVYGSLTGEGLGKKEAHAFAETAFQMGWSDEQLQDHLARSVNYRKLLNSNRLGGSAAEVKNQMRDLAASYGVRVSNKWVASNMERILLGNDTIEGARERILDMAKHRYVGFRDELEGGRTMDEIIEPYRQSMAQLLEMNPGEVDVMNNKIQNALMAKTKDGKPSPLSLHQFEDVVRKDPRWMKTDNAREQFATMGSELLKNFGLIA